MTPQRRVAMAMWLDVGIIVLVVALVLCTQFVHAQETRQQQDDDTRETIQEINRHLSYDDGRIDDLNVKMAYIEGIGGAVAFLATGSVALKFRGSK